MHKSFKKIPGLNRVIPAIPDGRRMLVALMAWSLCTLAGRAQNNLNVANFGATGDAVQFFANTMSNSTLVTGTNRFSPGDIGKAIEIFGAGLGTYGKNSSGVTNFGNEDLVATIINVAGGTNVFIDHVCQLTLTNTFATYGHDNSTNFQNAIAAATGTNTVIAIPSGTYLCLTRTNTGTHGTGLFFSSLVLTRGGLTFAGAGTNDTVLLGQGAWTIPYAVAPNGSTNTSVVRGWLFAIQTPVTNDFPFTVENLTLDGGVPQGNIGNVGYPANTVDGIGWDGTHDALNVYGGSGNTFTHQLWTNVVFRHWRGEMLKSTDASSNGNATIVNCVFNDGNATAINYYPSLMISNCVFNNLFQIAEYYQAYNTNTGFFLNNLCTNITGNGFAFNGGKGNNPPFIVQSNLIYSMGGSAILTTPGDNLVIKNNQIVGLATNRLVTGVNLGCPGYQGTFDNSNIVIAANNFTGVNTMISLGGLTATSPNRCESIQIYGNTVVGGSITALAASGWTTNISFASNDLSLATNGAAFTSGAGGSEYVLIPTNNNYWSPVRDVNGVTNFISYATGSRYKVWYNVLPKTVWALSDIDSNQIPPGAQMMIANATYGNASFPVFLDSGLKKGPITVTNGQTFVADWNGSAWVIPTVVQPPTNLRVVK